MSEKQARWGVGGHHTSGGVGVRVYQEARGGGGWGEKELGSRFSLKRAHELTQKPNLSSYGTSTKKAKDRSLRGCISTGRIPRA